MRKGFTMIELIFVIVILGILAAVAIPRLSATRDDAQISRGASDVATAVQDLGAFYTAQGTWSNAITDMTNVPFDGANPSNGINYEVGNAEDCITFTTAADGNLTVSDAGGTSAVCRGVVGRATDLLTTHEFGGQGVNY